MRIYSQGIASDGPAILCDGISITPDMIVETLNRLVANIIKQNAENQRMRKAIEYEIELWEDDDIDDMDANDIVKRLQKALEEGDYGSRI